MHYKPRSKVKILPFEYHGCLGFTMRNSTATGIDGIDDSNG